MKRIGIFLVCIILVTSCIMVVFPVETVKASGNTLYVGGSGSGNYTTIQSAIDASSAGYTIFVYDDSSPYYEHLYIDKSISLVGEDKNSTIIYGDSIHHCINISANWVNIYGFTIQGGVYGINLYKNDTVMDCKISNNFFGIQTAGIWGSSVGNNIIQNCEISNNTFMGMHIIGSSNNTIKGNTFIFDSIALGGFLKDCYQNIDTSNTVNGKPLYYFFDEKDKVIDNWNIGQLLLVNCTGFIIKNIEIYNTDGAIGLIYSSNNTISNCVFSNNMMGLGLWFSSNNIIENNIANNNTGFPGTFGGWPSSGIYIIGSNNEIKNNDASKNYIGIMILSLSEFSTGNIIKNNNLTSNTVYGVCIYNALNNSVYHNNFINNTQNAYDDNSNIWDYENKGNYWDDYTIRYPGAHKIWGKGIWDTPYEIPAGDNTDRYPLLKQWPNSKSISKMKNNLLNQLLVEPEGRLIFRASSTGPCVAAWHGEATVEPTLPDFYSEFGNGFIINLGTMQYHTLVDNVFSNFILENNTVEQLWSIKEITLMSINWQHEGIKHSLRVVCKPQEETIGFFITDPKFCVLGVAPTFDPKNYTSNCLTYSGSYRNGTKNEKVSGYAVIATGAFPNSTDNPTLPGFKNCIVVQLYENKDDGKIEPFFVAIWFKNSWDWNGTIMPKAKTFNVNFWTLQRLSDL